MKPLEWKRLNPWTNHTPVSAFSLSSTLPKWANSFVSRGCFEKSHEAALVQNYNPPVNPPVDPPTQQAEVKYACNLIREQELVSKPNSIEQSASAGSSKTENSQKSEGTSNQNIWSGDRKSWRSDQVLLEEEQCDCEHTIKGYFFTFISSAEIV